MTSHYQKLMHRASETSRYAGTEINRQGVVHEVKEEGGERKFRCILGYTPDGKPWLSPWMSSQEHRSGGQRGQSKVTVGQNMMIQGPSLRQANATPTAEAKHAPQPKHAPEVNGESMSVGGKLRTALHGGKEEEGSQGGQSGGGGAGGGGGQSGGGQQQQKGEEHHYEAAWIAEEKEEMQKYKPGDGKAKSSSGSQLGGSSDFGRANQQQQKPQEQKEEKRAMQRVMHEKEGFTNVIGKGKDAVRNKVHPKGSGMTAGKENYVVAEKDKDTIVRGKDDVYLTAKDKNIYAYAEMNPYVNKPWVIKEKKKDDPIPNHDLGGKSGGGGGGGGGASA